MSDFYNKGVLTEAILNDPGLLEKWEKAFVQANTVEMNTDAVLDELHEEWLMAGGDMQELFEFKGEGQQEEWYRTSPFYWLKGLKLPGIGNIFKPLEWLGKLALGGLGLAALAAAALWKKGKRSAAIRKLKNFMQKLVVLADSGWRNEKDERDCLLNIERQFRRDILMSSCRMLTAAGYELPVKTNANNSTEFMRTDANLANTAVNEDNQTGIRPANVKTGKNVRTFTQGIQIPDDSGVDWSLMADKRTYPTIGGLKFGKWVGKLFRNKNHVHSPWAEVKNTPNLAIQASLTRKNIGKPGQKETAGGFNTKGEGDRNAVNWAYVHDLVGVWTGFINAVYGDATAKIVMDKVRRWAEDIAKAGSNARGRKEQQGMLSIPQTTPTNYSYEDDYGQRAKIKNPMGYYEQLLRTSKAIADRYYGPKQQTDDGPHDLPWEQQNESYKALLEENNPLKADYRNIRTVGDPYYNIMNSILDSVFVVTWDGNQVRASEEGFINPNQAQADPKGHNIVQADGTVNDPQTEYFKIDPATNRNVKHTGNGTGGGWLMRLFQAQQMAEGGGANPGQYPKIRREFLCFGQGGGITVDFEKLLMNPNRPFDRFFKELMDEVLMAGYQIQPFGSWENLRDKVVGLINGYTSPEGNDTVNIAQFTNGGMLGDDIQGWGKTIVTAYNRIYKGLNDVNDDIIGLTQQMQTIMRDNDARNILVTRNASERMKVFLTQLNQYVCNLIDMTVQKMSQGKSQDEKGFAGFLTGNAPKKEGKANNALHWLWEGTYYPKLTERKDQRVNNIISSGELAYFNRVMFFTVPQVIERALTGQVIQHTSTDMLDYGSTGLQQMVPTLNDNGKKRRGS